MFLLFAFPKQLFNSEIQRIDVKDLGPNSISDVCLTEQGNGCLQRCPTMYKITRSDDSANQVPVQLLVVFKRTGFSLNHRTYPN